MSSRINFISEIILLYLGALILCGQTCSSRVALLTVNWYMSGKLHPLLPHN